MRDAAHWADQIHRLNSLGWSTYTPVTHHTDIQLPHDAAGPTVHGWGFVKDSDIADETNSLPPC